MKQYRRRLFSVILLFASGLLLSSAALLLPSYMSLKIEHTRLDNEINTSLSQISEKNSQGLVTTLNEIRSLVSLASPETTKIHDAVKLILAKKPSNLSITSIRFIRGVGEPSSLELEGVAGSRLELITFSKTLESDPMFLSVGLPVSNLAKGSDADYTLSLKGRF